jgi:hypothetical protein
MALTVSDVMKLPALSGFRPAAGIRGMDRIVVYAEIADYEFADGLDFDPSNAFERDALVISSLLFAKDDPGLILPAVQTLHDSGTACFAYKQVIYDKLPEEVLDYAEKENFPIFSFGTGTWFENIIYEVINAVEHDDSRHLSEEHIEKMIRGTASPDELDTIRHGISLQLDKTISAAYLRVPGMDASRLYRSCYMNKSLRDKLLAARYDDGIFLLVTTPGGMSRCTGSSSTKPAIPWRSHSLRKTSS